MQSPLNNAGIFLINTLFDLYVFVLLIRVLLVALRIHYFNPISQIIVKLTQPIIVPMRRVIPNYKNIELSSVLALLLVEILKFALLGLIVAGMPNLVGLVILAFADALKSLVNIFFYAIILQAIMSWVSAGNSPLSDIIHKITAPIIQPFQRLIPTIGGMDISPIPALMMLQLILILFISPLFATGWGIAFG